MTREPTRPIDGRASAAATAAFARRQRAAQPRLEPTAFRALSGTGLTVSKVGYGTYRVHVDVPEHHATLAAAIRRGCNCIDTSSNYTDGGSERLIGAVLGDLIGAGAARREEILLVSKVGYLQGQNLELAARRQAQGSPWPEVVTYQEGCWHCIHPDFLADQLERSLARLRCAALDVYLLHNPEYFFAHALHGADSQDLPALRDEFYRRVERAFAQLERFIQEGRLSFYGISSNTFPNPREDGETVSLDRVLAAARRAAEEVLGDPERHHCKVLQLPYNLFESGALTERNTPVNGASATVLEAAAAWGIGVLVNRPLNAIRGDAMRRLARPALEAGRDYAGEIEANLRALRATEAALRQEMEGWPQPPRLQDLGPQQQLFFDVGEVLAANLARLPAAEQWEMIVGQIMAPNVRKALEEALRRCPPERREAWQGRQPAYVEQLNSLLAGVRSYHEWRAAQQMAPLDDRLAACLPPGAPQATLSQKALQFVASSPGVSVVLNGMKRSPYVDDALAIMAMPGYDDVMGLAAAAYETS